MEQLWGEEAFGHRRGGPWRRVTRVEGPLAYLCRGLEKALGGVALFEVYSAPGEWEIRAYRTVPGEGRQGVSTYLPDERVSSMTAEVAARVGSMRGAIINGIFVAAGAP